MVNRQKVEAIAEQQLKNRGGNNSLIENNG